MAEGKMAENHLTSAAAFVEGGIQDACDDACSICLEDFCDSEPSTLTTCKHEFHLQCILEWCQRSSQCPMCWQAISLKDPDSQELLDAVEHERNLQMNPPRNTTIFHHPTLGDFELQHLPVNATESELEERILQHLAAAAAMGRARHLARREGHRTRSSAHARPQFLVFSTHSNGVSTTPSAAPVSQIDNSSPPAVMLLGSNSSVVTVGEDSTRGITQSSPTQSDRLMATAIGSSAGANEHGISNSRCPNQTIPHGQDRSGPSDLQSFSESVKSRIGALSMRCKESISKSTRGWKEKLFARNNSTPDPITEVRRDVAGVSSLRDHLEIAEDNRPNISMVSHNSENSSTQDHIEQQTADGGGYPSLNEEDPRASHATSSAPNTNAVIAMRL